MNKMESNSFNEFKERAERIARRLSDQLPIDSTERGTQALGDRLEKCGKHYVETITSDIPLSSLAILYLPTIQRLYPVEASWIKRIMSLGGKNALPRGYDKKIVNAVRYARN